MNAPPLRRRLATLTRAHTVYKKLLSPILHTAISGLDLAGGCRFQPTCSEYATLAFAQHGALGGLWLATLRLLRCHPLSRGGWDPVPSPCQGHPPPPAHLTPAAGTIEVPHSTQDPA